MKVDCYNASEIWFADIEVGDTFYYCGTLYLKVTVVGESSSSAVDLGRGYIIEFEPMCCVQLAKTRVVVDE